MHRFKISEKLKKILAKLLKRDSNLYNQLSKKMDDVVNCKDIEHYKNLQYNMKDSKRVILAILFWFFNTMFQKI